MAMFYPTESGWIEEMRDGWIDSGCRYFSFSFLDFLPDKLEIEPFWMYLYFTEKSTQDPILQRKIRYRALIIDHNLNTYINRNDVYRYSFNNGNPKIWFLCSQLEEIRKIDASFLTDADFEHIEDKKLLSSIRNSIAPVRKLSPINIIQKTLNEIQD